MGAAVFVEGAFDRDGMFETLGVMEGLLERDGAAETVGGLTGMRVVGLVVEEATVGAAALLGAEDGVVLGATGGGVPVGDLELEISPSMAKTP